ESRCKVQRRRVDKCAIIDAAARSLDECVGRRVEVGKMVAGDKLRRDVLVAQTSIDRQLRASLYVILHIEEVHVLVVIDDPEVIQLIGSASASQEIRKICCL